MAQVQNPVTRILNLVRLERKEIAAVYFYAILNGLIVLSLPIGVQAIVGFVMGASFRASIYVLILLVVAGVLASGLMQINQMKIIEKIQQRIFVRYAFIFAERIPKLDLRKADALYLPELVNRFFDTGTLQKSLAKILLEIPTATIQIVFGLVLLSFYHPTFILFGILLILLLWLILYYTGSRGLQTSLEESMYKYRVAGWLEEIARVVKSIKLAANHDLHLKKTDENVVRYLDARNRHFRILLFQYRTLVAFKTIITAAMLLVGSVLLVRQQLNIGQFVAAEIVIITVINSVEKLIGNLDSVYDTLTAVDKLAKLTDKPIEENGTFQLPNVPKGLSLEMRHVSFGYSEEKEVIRGVNLRIDAGEQVCIMGADGTGKSTLLRLMDGAYTDFKGAITIDGVPIGNYERNSLRQGIGLLLSQQDIFNGTLWENLTMGNESISRQDVIDLVEKAGLSEFIGSLKQGFDTPLDPTGKRLSRNVSHKILLVRALATRPRLLLLEDPWTGMDDRYRSSIIKLLREIGPATVVVISNDEEFARQCDKVIRVAPDGTVSAN
ncbi:MAG: hypothetical protein RJA57_265 [Bacteroidota bacterium]